MIVKVCTHNLYYYVGRLFLFVLFPPLHLPQGLTWETSRRLKGVCLMAESSL